ncbi:MAG TPA: LysR family transcriptional regulator [Scandinavium sp.]|uniref:LysR family transcriptional regulator n=1 Tax=Scandinavium sp. TaxID=2830653 RepID=UPI002E34F0C5|nr:LysR family transcriptional regulator [Scandinavium sp.]HEX4500044.1 LysR family transcriptional regulator [Scandinavium sp.]
MTLTQIMAFVQTVECGGFTKAGERLHMSQSAVSQAVAGIEAELGVILLARNRRKGLSLTPVGKSILERFTQILYEIEEIHHLAALDKTELRATLHLGCFSSILVRILPNVVRLFAQRYPHIELILHEENNHKINEDVKAGEFDLGFVDTESSGVHSVPLFKDHFKLIVSDNHPTARKNRKFTLKDLHQQDLIVSKSRYEKQILDYLAENKIEPLVKYEFSHPSTALNFVRQGLGVTLLPDMTFVSTEPGVTAVSLGDHFYRDIFLITKSQPHENSALKLLIDFIVETIEKEKFKPRDSSLKE